MSEKRFLKVLNREVTDRAPFWFMRQAGRYLPEYRETRASCKGFLDLCYTPEKAAEVTLQPIRRFGMDAAILFADILVVPDALGAEVAFVEGEGPKLKPLTNEKDLQALSVARVSEHVQPVYETIRRVKEALPKEVALIGFAGAPWTVACYMVEGGGSREFDKVRRFALEQPEVFAKLIHVLEAATLDYLSGQVDNGAEVLQLFDSWAGVLPPEDFDEWVVQPTRRIAKALKKKYPQIPLIGFPRLAGSKLPAYAAIEELDAVSIDQATDIAYADFVLSTAPAKPVAQGNLDPALLGYNLPRMMEQAQALVSRFKGRPYIFNLGHGMTPQIPIAHVEKLCDLLKTGI